MRSVLFLALIFCVSQLLAQNKSYDYCYRIGIEEYRLYSLLDKKEYPIFKSKFPIPVASLSPDGKKVVYSFYPPPSKGISFIGILDINTKHRIVLNTYGNECAEPMWSPDGKLISYQVWNEKLKKQDIAIIDVGNHWHRVLTNKLPEMWGAAWTNDSKKIIASDQDSIFLIDLNGKVSKIYKISDITKNRWCKNFRLTADGRKFVFLYHVDETVNLTGGSSAVFVYDFATKKALKLSPKGYDFHNIIIHENKILATGEKANGVPKTGIYSIDLDGKNFKLFLPNAGDITLKN